MLFKIAPLANDRDFLPFLPGQANRFALGSSDCFPALAGASLVGGER